VPRKAVPADVEQAVMRALEKLPADRFESAATWHSAGISSAARRVAFVTQDSASVPRVYVRELGDVRARRLDGVERRT